jgi:hypothetical protein
MVARRPEREALAFGKAVYDRRTALSMTVAEVAMRAGMTADQIEPIEEGGAERRRELVGGNRPGESRSKWAKAGQACRGKAGLSRFP